MRVLLLTEFTLKSGCSKELGLIIDTLHNVSCTSRITKFPLFTDVVPLTAGGADVYRKYSVLYRRKVPGAVKRHREFFKRARRGFGEDPFHAMWLSLFLEFKPLNCLEIGVYRGQIVSLWGLLAKKLDIKSDIYALSPFEAIGDSVGSYIGSVDYQTDVISNLKKFRVENVTLVKALSETEIGKEFILSRAWDLIYIDGSHDYEIVRQDCSTSLAALNRGGLMVMDDAALYRGYTPSSGAFAGHPGPSEVAEELISGRIGSGELDYLGHVGHNLVFRKR
jgi:hypothetical protein